jgi:hypothetical protein
MNETQLKSIYRFGGWISLVVAVGFFLVGVLVAIDPAERLRGEAIYQAFAEQPTIPLVWRYIFVAIGILSVAVINALSRYVRRAWGRGLGRDRAILHPHRPSRNDLERPGLDAGDHRDFAAGRGAHRGKPRGHHGAEDGFALEFRSSLRCGNLGCLGFFYLLISLLAWRNRSLPRGLSRLGYPDRRFAQFGHGVRHHGHRDSHRRRTDRGDADSGGHRRLDLRAGLSLLARLAAHPGGSYGRLSAQNATRQDPVHVRIKFGILIFAAAILLGTFLHCGGLQCDHEHDQRTWGAAHTQQLHCNHWVCRIWLGYHHGVVTASVMGHNALPAIWYFHCGGGFVAAQTHRSENSV